MGPCIGRDDDNDYDNDDYDSKTWAIWKPDYKVWDLEELLKNSIYKLDLAGRQNYEVRLLRELRF